MSQWDKEEVPPPPPLHALAFPKDYAFNITLPITVLRPLRDLQAESARIQAELNNYVPYLSSELQLDDDMRDFITRVTACLRNILEDLDGCVTWLGADQVRGWFD
ncbi:hypothetical protein H0H92_016050 [Tricholoma furcatifolium]|nr:hypothetical protein H0H92_016050 [Tricholoma furcatifolium]